MTTVQSTKSRTPRKSKLATSTAPAGLPVAKAAKTKKAGTSISAQSWHEMVATAAYYRAQARDFQRGSPAQDWLDAEAELKRQLGKTR